MVTLQDRGIETLTGHTNFVSDDDSLVLEDESARMALKGNAIPAGPLVTGVVAAVRGVSSANGDFQVKVCLPHLRAASPAKAFVTRSSTFEVEYGKHHGMFRLRCGAPIQWNL